MIEEIKILDLIKESLKKWHLLLVAAIVSGLLGFLLTSYVIPPKYASVSKVYIRGTTSLSASLADLQLGTYLSKDYEEIFKSRPVLESTINRLKLEKTTKELLEMITVETITDTRIIKVTCKTTSPDLSREIVNTIVDNAINKVKEIDAKVPYIIEKAISNNEPVSLSPLKATVLSTVAGLFLCFLVISLNYLLNRKIETEEDLAEIGLNILGSVYEDENIKTPKIVETKEHNAEE